MDITTVFGTVIVGSNPAGCAILVFLVNYKYKYMKKFQKFIHRNTNLNLILSGISLVYVWRGVWSLTDMFTFGTYVTQEFWSYLIPMVVALFYLYINDFKLSELVHIKD